MALITLAMQAWSPQWWGGLIATIFIIVATAIHMVSGASAKRVTRITTVLFLAIGGPWFGYWYYSNYPASSKIMQAWFPVPVSPTKVATPINAIPRKTEATLSKAYYKCKNNGDLTPEDAAKNASEFKAYIEAYAAAYGYKSPIVATIAGGNKAELIPLIANTDPSKRTFQVVRIGKELIGVYSADYL
jgi:hypothetical protein